MLFRSNPEKLAIEHHKPLHEKYNFILIDTEKKLQQLCKELQGVTGFAVDTETTGLDVMSCSLVGISICYEVGRAYYIPFRHKVEAQQSLFGEQKGDFEQLSKQQVLDQLQPIFGNKNIKKYLHHAKFDQIVLNREGFDLHFVTFDTLIAASLLCKEWEKKGLKEDRKSTRLNSSHEWISRMPSSA